MRLAASHPRWPKNATGALLASALIPFAISLGVGCSKRNTTSAAAPPLTVDVTEVVQKDVPIYREWIGTLDGFVNADIKAEVSGYLISKPIKRVHSSKGPIAFSNRSTPLSGGARSGEGATRKPEAY